MQWNFFDKRKNIYTTNSIFPIDSESTASVAEGLNVAGFFHACSALEKHWVCRIDIDSSFKCHIQEFF